ncbi:MAG: alpha-glucosidase C-terminal domain-containing protein [Calditrichaeota bacterium]|nr:alpha-glucosidase C-terminal domain-containing protein [Calditrichota bacterium]HQU73197.1 alpha-amylase family glycosyl hydrolase [Calditrichia bacterium]
MKLLPLLLAALLLLCQSCQDKPLPVFDAIGPINLVSGRPDTLDLRDLFPLQPPLDLQFVENPHLRITHLREEGRLILQPKADFEGSSVVSAFLNRQPLDFPVFCEIREPTRFSFTPKKAVQKLTVFGAFNSWNRDLHPLTDPDGDGTYTLTLSLEPGRYEYKFFVDGEELVDPQNPVKIPNPFGSYNSLLTVPPRHTETAFLHQLGWQDSAGYSRLRFAYQRENQPAPLAPSAVLAFLDNELIIPEHLEISANILTLTLPKAALPGARQVRVAVSQDGVTTPFQNVVLNEGRPAGAGQFEDWRGNIIYSLMPDRFEDGNPANTRKVDNPDLADKANFYGGDLQGILNRLESGYFDSLGVNALWIFPVNRNPEGAFAEFKEPHRLFSGYHGYWPVDSREIDPRFGDMDLFKQLVERAHQKGFKVLLDFVANHVHIEHPYFAAHPAWFSKLDLPDGRQNLRHWDEFRLTTWFDTFLPTFDYENADSALEVMTDNAIWWLRETGIDGFRHDAVKHVPNLFWRRLTQKIHREIEVPQGRRIFQIGETFGSYPLVKSYVNPGQLDAQFNFNLYFTARQVFLDPQGSFINLRDELAQTHQSYGFAHQMGNLMDSHDQVRYMAFADGDLLLTSDDAEEVGWHHPPVVDDPLSYRAAELYLAYILTIPGVPTLYYGDEIGMSGVSDPDNRRPMRFGDQVTPDEGAFFAAVAGLNKIRLGSSALQGGDFLPLLCTRDVFAYLRSDMHQRILVVLNKSGQAQQLNIPLPALYGLSRAEDLQSWETLTVSGNSLKVNVRPMSYRIFETK